MYLIDINVMAFCEVWDIRQHVLCLAHELKPGEGDVEYEFVTVVLLLLDVGLGKGAEIVWGNWRWAWGGSSKPVCCGCYSRDMILLFFMFVSDADILDGGAVRGVVVVVRFKFVYWCCVDIVDEIFRWVSTFVDDVVWSSSG